MKSRRRRKKKKEKERKRKKKKKVGENNGQLRFVRHHVWRTQARLDQKFDNLAKTLLRLDHLLKVRLSFFQPKLGPIMEILTFRSQTKSGCPSAFGFRTV